MLFFVMNPMVAKADELFFDEDGNLYFHTREKKAVGDVSYKTIGWIIKRYDMPMDAPGQQYVIVKKENYRPDVPDPNDDRYVLSYFKSDRDEILNAVKKVSAEWYKVLTEYGDDVYVDSVMTVCNKGVECGKLYSDGTSSGEVYFTYEGIAGARKWTSISVQVLKVHFNRVLEFPQQIKKWEPYVEIISSQDVYINDTLYSSFMMGAGDYGNEDFNILEGIPSGEDIYLKGAVSSRQGVLRLKKVNARLTECVEVPVTYRLCWTDYYGVKREDVRVIYRYYAVTREFTYYEYVGFDEYFLDTVGFTGAVLGTPEAVSVSVGEPKETDIEVKAYGGAWSHIVSYEKTVATGIGTVLLTGSNGKKPAIPDADYSGIADEQVSDIKVKNDRVIIEGKVVLSDSVNVKNGKTPAATIELPRISLYENGIGTGKEIANGKYDDCLVTLTYRNESGKTRTYKRSSGSVVIHTPVYCEGTAFGDKALNQAVTPTDKDVVLGEDLVIAFNDFGRHRDILGYGLGSYSKYAGSRQVCCPFAVEYNGVRYEENTWIDVAGHNVRLRVCEENAEGEYTILMRTFAYNSDGKMSEGYIEKQANLDMGKYGAWSSKQVRLIGKIHKLQVESEGVSCSAGEMPLQIIPEGNTSYNMDFEIVGDMSASDYVRIDYTYYYEDADGVLMPVDVYGIKDRNYIDNFILERFKESETLSMDMCTKTGNISEWSVSNPVYMELVAVPCGTNITDVEQALKDNKLDMLFYKGGSIIVCADITSFKDEEAHLSYINEENAVKGYCNMWLREGGTDKYPYGAVVKIGLGEDTYYDYEVSGTH